MSWIADYDTHGREFPTCVHVTKTTGGMTHGATYVPIQDGKDVRAENAKLREERREYQTTIDSLVDECTDHKDENAKLRELVAEMFNACPMCVNCAHNHLTVGWYDRIRELGIEVSA